MSPRPAPKLLSRASTNLAGQRTTKAKLNGQVYTPDALAFEILQTLGWPSAPTPLPPGRLLDPACGDGAFLLAAARAVLEAGLPRAQTADLLQHSIVGWELDPKALTLARQRLKKLLTPAGYAHAMPTLLLRDSLEHSTPANAKHEPPFNLIVGNPPYLEAKRMPATLKTRLRESYPLSARGAFDLYAVFVERVARLLQPGGRFALLLPNRILTAAHAAQLRLFLLRHFSISVTDLSKEQVFDGAAVYPVLLQGVRVAHAETVGTVESVASDLKADPSVTKGSRQHSKATPSKPDQAVAPSASPGYQVLPRLGSSRALSLPAQLIREQLGGTYPLAPTQQAGRRLLTRALTDYAPIQDQMRLRWTVSFHRAGLRDRFVFPDAPAQARPKLRRFLGGGRFAGNREVEAFSLRWAGSSIDYDEDRARAEGNPLPPLSLFLAPKVVICQHARRARAALDLEGYVLKDTFLAASLPTPSAGAAPTSQGQPPDLAPLAWLCLVLNSRLFHYLFEHIHAGTRKGGAFLHFLPGNLACMPLPPAPEQAEALHRRRALLQAAHRESQASQDSLTQAAAESEQETESLIADAYRLRPAERKVLAAYPIPPHTHLPTQKRLKI